MASPAVSRHIRRIKKTGSRTTCGPWNLFWLRGEGGYAWHITCARGLGGAVERHQQERRAREVLRGIQKGKGAGLDLALVVEWARPSGIRLIKEGLEQIRLRVKKIILDAEGV